MPSFEEANKSITFCMCRKTLRSNKQKKVPFRRATLFAKITNVTHDRKQETQTHHHVELIDVELALEVVVQDLVVAEALEMAVY